MRKLMLTLCLVAMCSTITCAECEIKTTGAWWTDTNRFEVVFRTFNTNEQQAKSMMLDDLKTGKAIRLEQGTKIDEVITHPENNEVCIIRVRNQGLVGLLNYIKCK